MLLTRKLFLLFLLLKLTSLQAQMPVPVHEEPRHHPVFQNKEVRILNVLLPPGDTTLYHIHHTPSVFINFTTTFTGSQLQGDVLSKGKSTAGRILFENLSPPNIRTHRVWNDDKDTFHVIDVELLYTDTGFVQQPLMYTELKLEVDNAWIRIYRLNLLKGKEFKLDNKKQAFMLVALKAASVKTKKGENAQDLTLRPGSFIDIERGNSFILKNKSDNTIQFVLLEFPGR